MCADALRECVSGFYVIGGGWIRLFSHAAEKSCMRVLYTVCAAVGASAGPSIGRLDFEPLAGR